MIKQIKFPRVKLIIILSLYFLLIISCKKENVCTLNPEQSPEIRGFRIGQSYDDIASRFPEMCKPYIEIEKENKMSVRFNFGGKDENNCEPNNSGATVYYYLSPEKYPDFNGIEGIGLTFSNKRLIEFSINYERSRDRNFESSFKNKSIASLGLSEWTNWKTEEKSETDFSAVGIASSITSYSDNNLLCNKLKIRIFVHSASKLNSDEPTIYFPSITVSETQDVAITTSQQNEIKQQKEQQKRNELQKRNEEEKRKTETFKP